MDTMQRISSNILRLLDESGATSTDLAKKLGVTRQTLTNYLKGNTIIDTLKLVQIAEFFHVSINELIDGEQDRKFSLLFRTALNYSDSINQCEEKISEYIDRYKLLAKSIGQNVAFSPEQYNLQIEVNSNILDINYELDDYTSKYKITEKLDSEIEQIANDQRRLLGLEDQGALSLIPAIVARGINVIFLDFGTPDMFGLSLCDNVYGSYIFINDENSITAERKLFTLAHEYGHLLLHRPLYSRRMEQHMAAPEKMESKKKSILDAMADCFAGYLLCPYTLAKKHIETLVPLRNLSELVPMKHELQISLSSLMMSLNKYGFIAKSTLTAYFAFLKEQHLEKKEVSPFTENSTLGELFFMAKNKQLTAMLKIASKKGLASIDDVPFFLGISADKASALFAQWIEEANPSTTIDFNM